MSTKAASTGRTEGAPRNCGECNVCCTAMGVKSLDKPAGVPCDHQIEVGCSIYDHRPEVCRTWYCMWVRDDKGVFNDDQRPDQIGVFFTASQPSETTGEQFIYAHEICVGSSEWPQAKEAIDYLRQFVRVDLLRFKGTTTELTVFGESAA